MSKKFLSMTFLLLFAGLAACSSGSTSGSSASADAASAVTAATDAPEVADEIAEVSAPASSEADDDVARPDGWTEETHSNDVDPNYSVVFPDDKVNTTTITIDPADWEAMQADMTEI
ncbi:MAG TPA: hypothetical protein PLR07_12350, partial [Promineifilum sp.]|nr:hypothetical protein [Promineifilum sp.]